MIRCDRSLQNREKSYTEVSSAPNQVTNIRLDATYQAGKGERAGKTRKRKMKSAIHAKQANDLDDLCLLVAEMNAVRKDIARVGEFLPSQWYLGKLPRRQTGGQMGSESFAGIGPNQTRVNGQIELARIAEYRKGVQEGVHPHRQLEASSDGTTEKSFNTIGDLQGRRHSGFPEKAGRRDGGDTLASRE